MGSRMLLMAVALAVLSGCQTGQSTGNSNPDRAIPPDYKVKILAYAEKNFRDPYSLRSAEISDPKTIWVGMLFGGNVPGICLRVNSKNRYGAYVGLHTFSIAFQDGDVFLFDEPLFASCSKATWNDFPELENIR